ncbi:MAG: hypothetical protein IPO08_21295 [Xanthomonadales bacterium]|jgi:hypothetical protein|nr:hypothetical protein [Xanthomonadales bacterium]
MTTEAALFVAHNATRTKLIAVPERAVRHLIGKTSIWRVVGPGADALGIPAALAERVINWVNPATRKIAVASAIDVGVISSNRDSFAMIFGPDGQDGDTPHSIGRVVLDEAHLDAMPNAIRPVFLQARSPRD